MLMDLPEPKSPDPPPPPIYAIATDALGVVDRTHMSNVLPEDFIEVSPEIFHQAMIRLGAVRWTGTGLEPCEPPPPLPPPDSDSAALLRRIEALEARLRKEAPG